MTLEEKRRRLISVCDGMETCSTCQLRNNRIMKNCDFGGATEEEIEGVYAILNDPVDHPSHYCREGGMESIDEMVLVFGKEAVMNFCLLNVWKYRYRAADKNGEEYLKKSDWYMRKYKELKELEEET